MSTVRDPEIDNRAAVGDRPHIPDVTMAAHERCPAAIYRGASGAIADLDSGVV